MRDGWRLAQIEGAIAMSAATNKQLMQQIFAAAGNPDGAPRR